jgi:hypothetical protein
MPSLGEAPNGGAKRFAYFWASAKVSRCKSETASSRYCRNGYVPNPNPKILLNEHHYHRTLLVRTALQRHSLTTKHPRIFRWRTADDRY